ncbi:MAG: hypothetical protein RRY79_05560 [Clostridia bacterium]
MTSLIKTIKEKYIDIIDRNETTVGVEIELPLLSMQNAPVELSFIDSLFDYIKSIDFIEKKITLDGHICEVENKNGDLCSFETTWNTLEFSMKNTRSLLTIEARFNALLTSIQAFCLEHGYYLCGRGINPNYASIDISPLNTPILLAKSAYLKEFTQHHDGEIFHSIMTSVQTQLDAVDAEHYIALYNLIRKVYALEGLFFANSMPISADFIATRPALHGINRDTLCFRDELWRLCGAPNTIDELGDLPDTDALCRKILGQKLFIVPSQDGFCAITPISIYDYFSDSKHGIGDLSCFRSLEPIAPTKNGSLEIRSTCTQPLSYMFEPSAFYLGLSANLEQAKKQVNKIYDIYFTGDTPREVRDKLMKASNHDLRQSLKSNGQKLLGFALDGLKSRNMNEEALLIPLIERMRNKCFQPPVYYTKEGNLLLETEHEMSAISQRRYL